MSLLLFVYGTLMPSTNHPMAHRLASEADFIGAGEIGGRLYDLGRMPGLILSDRPAERVSGEVWRLRSACSLDWLDRYEGIHPDVPRPEYERLRRTVELASGRTADAAVYVYRWPLGQAPRIESGRWLRPWTGDAAAAAALGRALEPHAPSTGSCAA